MTKIPIPSRGRKGAGQIFPRFLLPLLLLAISVPAAAAVKRVVILKLDGVPEDVLERELQHINPTTGKSSLPWMDRVFVHGGTRLANFYVRAISLSAPSWSLLDTGQHLQIRGNAEFDRYTYHIYDYLNFFPFYLGYALSHKVDMPAVEVLDDLGIPLLIDRFPYDQSYQSFQLYQRGVRWKTLQRGFQSHISRPLRELLDEWTIGLEIGSSVEEQTEKELIAKLNDPGIRYLDYFTGEYDHVAHSTPDPASQRVALQRVDGLVGRLWTAIQSSPLAAETALVVVSDHGMNTQTGVYSQGYDLVRFFNSAAAGGHHVVTDRHPMTEYKLKGLDPFVSEVVTPSEESPYLKGQSDQYPTALLDLDGNERASVYLRNSDLNAMHILLNQITRSPAASAQRREAIGGIFRILDRHRVEWQNEVVDLRAEMAVLRRAMAVQRAKIESQPKQWTGAQRDQGLDKESRRLSVQLDAWRDQEHSYSAYADALARLLTLGPTSFDNQRFAAQDLIPKRSMGDANNIHDLQNYVTGPGTANEFQRVNYFELLTGITVRNNVQAAVAARPVDFIAMRISRRLLARDEDAVWLYGDRDHQAILLSRHDASGSLELRYLTVRSLEQDAAGKIQYEAAALGEGFPLKLWEDKQLAVPEAERAAWFDAWHSEIDWMHAIHKTRYSNGLIALHEQFLMDDRAPQASGDAGLLRRFTLRKRRLAQPDFIVFANDHWNFNVRGFNPGGNHGSLLRISSHSVLMLAGGEQTGIPADLKIEEPYDSLSFVPTILELMGVTKETAPLPGRLIRELVPQPSGTAPRDIK